MKRSERWVWRGIYVFAPLIVMFDVGIWQRWW